MKMDEEKKSCWPRVINNRKKKRKDTKKIKISYTHAMNFLFHLQIETFFLAVLSFEVETNTKTDRQKKWEKIIVLGVSWLKRLKMLKIENSYSAWKHWSLFLITSKILYMEIKSIALILTRTACNKKTHKLMLGNKSNFVRRQKMKIYFVVWVSDDLTCYILNVSSLLSDWLFESIKPRAKRLNEWMKK